MVQFVQIYTKYKKIGVVKMKVKLLSAAVLSTLLLTACQQEDTSQNNELESQSKEITEVESTETENSDAESEDESEELEIDEIEVAFQYKVNPTNFSIVPIDSEEESNEKLALLTFDDAPYGNSLEIADALEERGVSALFFVNGMYMEKEDGFEVIQNLYERGFEIANHTHTHAKLDDYSEEDQLKEIEKTNDIIKEATGENPRFFRAPHGVMTDYTKQVIADKGMSWMNWSFGYDWMGEYHDAAALTEITLTTNLLSNGANILMHDRTWTAEAVPVIVDGLIEQGFTIVDPKLITHEE